MAKDSGSRARFWSAAAIGAHAHLMGAMREPSPPAPQRFIRPALAQVNHKLFEVGHLERAVKELEARSGESKDSLQRAYAAMRAIGPWRPLAVAPSALNLDRLRSQFPNFAEVIDFLEAQMALSFLGAMRMAYFPPILLVGDPGLGKTAFASQLAEIIGTTFEEISLAGTTAGFTIAGMSSGWAGGKAGRILLALAWNGPSNPVVLLDEVCKAPQSKFDVSAALLGLIERHSACRFIDEFIEFPIDASRIMWVGTANTLETITRPLLSRMQVFHIQPPNLVQGRRIAQSVYVSLLSSSDWGSKFDDALPAGVTDLLAPMSPRAQRQSLLHALGRAARLGRMSLQIGDFHVPPREARRIGF